MAKTEVKKKEYFRFDNSHVLFFIALAVNYTWRSFDNLSSANWEILGGYGILGGGLLGWTLYPFISWVIWALSLYTLYLIYLNIREKRQAVANWIILVLRILFYTKGHKFS